MRGCRARLEPQEALRSLLSDRSPYGSAGSSTLAPFSDSRLSVPADVHGSPRVGDVCSAQVSNYQEGLASKMLRPALEVKAMDEAMGAAGVYTDPILEHDVEKRAKLMQRMIRIGMGRLALQ